MLAVEDGIGELRDPIAENQHSCLAVERQLQFYMAMTIDKIVDVGMRLHILLCPQHQILFVLTHIGRLLSVGAFQTTVLSPVETQLHAPPGMEEVEQTLTTAVVEDLAQEFELVVRVTQAVAMRQIELLAVDFRRQRIAVKDHATLLFKIAIRPYIMIAGEEMHFHAHVGQLRDLA